MADPTQRFSDRVDAYVRARPGYPQSLLAFLHAQLGLGAADPVADVGSGTGLLTELLLSGGHPTFAVEPNGPMRSAAEGRLGHHANFHSIDGTAESTTLPDGSVALVTAAQAFHWFDVDRARAEFRRILRPGGRVALIWNERRPAPSGLNAAYANLVNRYQADRGAATSRRTPREAMDRFFGTAGYQLATFDNPQRLDRAGLLARLASSSYMPLPPDPRHAGVIAEANALFDRFERDGVAILEQDTELYWGYLDR